MVDKGPLSGSADAGLFDRVGSGAERPLADHPANVLSRPDRGVKA